ncbi:non-hydrolyzing UDP-N-acetylglucosamine 2-epimerase [Glutamicibacter sp. BSL13]
MTNKLKVMTVVGTRPEIIRLSATIKLLDEHTEQVLVHTGQNYDYELNEVFFTDLGLRKPDHFLNADTSSLGAALGSILTKTEAVLLKEKPDAFLVLGDTNSCISAVIAKRMKVPVFHMEAGNRSFDENVPEETNRRLVDHVADYNLVYTEHGRRNLISEGIHPARILLTGSPMREVLSQNLRKIQASDVLERQGLKPKGYFLVSLHREENVDDPKRLATAVASLQAIFAAYSMPILVSTHPRTRKRLEFLDEDQKRNISFHPPFGFLDYIKLQQEAKAVLSDSGTISEEASMLGFPAITMRDFIERPEAQDVGAIITAGLRPEDVVDSVRIAIDFHSRREHQPLPSEYGVTDTSARVLAFIRSAAHSHYARFGIRAAEERDEELVTHNPSRDGSV